MNNNFEILLIADKPEQLTVNKSHNGFIDINEGQSVNITCTAKGNPDPHYYWVFDGKQLSNSSSGIITISNVTENKTGMYTCTAVNLVGNESIAVMLRVPCKYVFVIFFVLEIVIVWFL